MAKGNKRKFGSFRYPMARLESDSDYLEIKVVEYQPPGFDTVSTGSGSGLRLQTSSESLKKNKENILGTILLPVPESVTDSNGVTWGEDTLNGLAATALGIANDIITADSVNDAVQAGGDRGSDAVKQLVNDKGSISAINSIFASAAVNALGGTTSPEGILARQSGSILNPNMELLFGGVQLRTFSFDFDFAPRDSRESNEIKKIIRAFKVSMNAKNGSTGDAVSYTHLTLPTKA